MVFLAYARENWRETAEIERELAGYGIDVARDRSEPESNPFWRQKLKPLLEESRVLLVVWSESASISPWLDEEVRSYSTERIWHLLDDSPTPPYADRHEVKTTSCEELVAALQCAEKLGGTRAAGGMTGDWRLMEKCERAQRQLSVFAKDIPPPAELREIAAGILVHEATGVEFRRIRGSGYLATTSVTREQYEQFLEASGFPGNQHLHWPALGAAAPVVSVTWFEAMAYSYWLGGRLPSELEWESAAASATAPKYATATGGLSEDLAHFGRPYAKGSPLPEKNYPSNPRGFLGMCGNTWNWCLDAWGEHRSIRGGCWMDDARFCELTARYRNFPIDRDCAVGFRVCLACRPRSAGRFVAQRPTEAEFERLSRLSA